MSDSLSTPVPSDPLGLGWLTWAIPLAWLGFWLAGQPAPHPDDLFFGGAAIATSQGGGLSNPWIGNWLQEHFHSSRFFVQTPFHTWLQSAWLRGTGISGGALRAFALWWSGVGAFALADALRRVKVSRGWAAIACLVWAAFILGYGLRADAMGLGLIGAGHLLLVRRSFVSRLAGLWLGGLGAATHPFALSVALVVLGAHFILELRRTPAGKRTRGTLIMGGAAAGGALLVLLLGIWIIGGDEREFVRIFQEHRALALPGATDRWEFFSGQFTLGQEAWRRLPFVVLAAGLLGLAARRGPDPTPARAVLIGICAFAVIGYFLYAQYLARYLTFALFIALPVTLAGTRCGLPRLRLVGVGLVMLVGPSTDVLALVVRTLPPPRDKIESLRDVIATSTHRHLVLDEFSIRFLYDFRPPANCRDWQVGRPAGGRPLGFLLSAKPTDELWVVSTFKLAHTISGAAVTPDYIRLAGRSLHSIEIGTSLSVIR